MTETDWLNVLLGITGTPALIIFIILTIRDKSLSRLYFSLGIFSLLSGIALNYSGFIFSSIAMEWGNLMAVIFVLCALFVIIRNSKPVFARFPLYMTALPLLGAIFYPMINDAEVVKDLLMILYQGGALIVGLLIFGINQLILKNRILLLIGLFILAFGYVSYWFLNENILAIHKQLSVFLFASGMLTMSLGFKKLSDKKLEIN